MKCFPPSETKCPKTDFWKKLNIAFHFVDSMLFGQVGCAVFSGAVEIFFGCWVSLREIGLYAFDAEAVVSGYEDQSINQSINLDFL